MVAKLATEEVTGTAAEEGPAQARRAFVRRFNDLVQVMDAVDAATQTLYEMRAGGSSSNPYAGW